MGLSFELFAEEGAVCEDQATVSFGRESLADDLTGVTIISGSHNWVTVGKVH